MQDCVQRCTQSSELSTPAGNAETLFAAAAGPEQERVVGHALRAAVHFDLRLAIGCALAMQPDSREAPLRCNAQSTHALTGSRAKNTRGRALDSVLKEAAVTAPRKPHRRLPARLALAHHKEAFCKQLGRLRGRHGVQSVTEPLLLCLSGRELGCGGRGPLRCQHVHQLTRAAAGRLRHDVCCHGSARYGWRCQPPRLWNATRCYMNWGLRRDRAG